jgi:hypothetical protein
MVNASNFPRLSPRKAGKLAAPGDNLANATPAQLATLLTEDLACWSKIGKDSGARVD